LFNVNTKTGQIEIDPPNAVSSVGIHLVGLKHVKPDGAIAKKDVIV